jgi:hypothetical protein
VSVLRIMNYINLLFSVLFACIIRPSHGLFQVDWDERFDNSSDILPDDDIYKCVSYTRAHIDISHWINQNFSDYKDCQASGLYTLNRRDREFKVEIDVQRSWIVEVNYNRCYIR